MSTSSPYDESQDWPDDPYDGSYSDNDPRGSFGPYRHGRSEPRSAAVITGLAGAVLVLLVLLGATLMGKFAPVGTPLGDRLTASGTSQLPPAGAAGAPVAPSATPSPTPSESPSPSPSASPTDSPAAAPASPAASPASPGLTSQLAGIPIQDGLAARGATVVLDPGHNGGNAAARTQIAKLVDAGNGTKACNTVGTQNATLTEHALNFEVANKVKQLLEERGITVVMTRSDDVGVGPCVNERAAVANQAKAALAVSIHADGSDNASLTGFHVIAPAADPKLDHVVANRDQAVVTPSLMAAAMLRDEYLKDSSLPALASPGHPGGQAVGPGLVTRNDLGGLNLLQVPGVMIEMGEMTNRTDASVMATDGPDRFAAAIANAIMGFVASGRAG